MEVPCCIGRERLAGAGAKARCSAATSLPWCRTGATSASCEAIQILYRLDPRQYAASSKGSNLSHSSKFMAGGGKRTSCQMQKQQSCDRPSATCARSDLQRSTAKGPEFGRAHV